MVRTKNQPSTIKTMTNDEKIIALFKSRAVVQRRLKSIIEDLEAVTNELEEAIAAIENRKPVRKFIDLRVRDLSSVGRGE